jgi:hypothetical protein
MPWTLLRTTCLEVNLDDEAAIGVEDDGCRKLEGCGLLFIFISMMQNSMGGDVLKKRPQKESTCRERLQRTS